MRILREGRMSEAFPLNIFPNISWFVEALSVENEGIELEIFANWQKQTARTRYEIAGPNKKLKLVVPTQKSSRILLKDVKIDYSENWIKDHLRSLEASYNNSPFFEYYRGEVQELLNADFEKVCDFNLASIRWVFDKMGMDKTTNVTSHYQGIRPIKVLDHIHYSQVFSDRNGFVKGLSVLDLLFNLGPDSADFIHQHLPDKRPSH